MKTKLVIFDMDGVLVDACEWHKVALNEALNEHYGFIISDDEHIKIFNGIPTREKLKILTEQNRIDSSKVLDIEKSKQEKTFSIIEKMACKRQEKIELIKFLKSLDIKVACYTNSVRATAEMMLVKTGVFELLDLLLTNQDVENAKPHPEGYTLCMKKLNVHHDHTSIVEDSPKGLEAARRSLANVVEVNGVDDVNMSLIKEILR
jgi:HAD superfamily hydrolase (TIGR01509 family)